MQQAEGYDIPAVEQWIREKVPALSPPLTWERLPGGHSNLTFLLEDGNGRKAVIRRPPQGELLPKAHDMSREWSLISALGPTAVPVPEAIAFCENPDITGAWFYIMGVVEGRALHKKEDTLDYVPLEKRPKLAFSFFDTLAELHALDPDAIGLGELGKKDSYIARQLKTWYRSWNASIEAAQFDDPRVHILQQFFLDNLPEVGNVRVVHGDYGIHNCLISRDATVAAVLDWEISTLGDPLADLAYALNIWPEYENDDSVKSDAATTAEGFPSRSQLALRYAKRSGRSLEKLDYYRGLNYWKSACIAHGVYARYMAGQKSTEGVDLEALMTSVKSTLKQAELCVSRLD